MKMSGVTVEKMSPITVVINRGENKTPLVATCNPVLSYESFDKLCPLPTPPERILKGGTKEYDTTDKEYLERIKDYSEKRIFFLFLESVKDSIEFETVKLDDPNTWKNCTTEMTQSGLMDKEIQMIFDGAFEANALNEKRLEEARASFLAGRGVSLKS